MLWGSRRSSGLALLAFVGLFVVDPLLVGLHHHSQSHYFCAEHGTVEHPRGGSSERQLSGARRARWERSELPLPTPQEHAQCHHHELLSSQAWPASSAEPEVAPSTGWTSLGHPPAQPQRLSIWLLDYAPKQSPPV